MRSDLMTGFGIKYKTPIAIRAIDEVLVPHLQVNLRMPERAAASVAGHARLLNDHGFGRFVGHIRCSLFVLRPRIILGEARVATKTSHKGNIQRASGGEGGALARFFVGGAINAKITPKTPKMSQLGQLISVMLTLASCGGKFD